MLITEGDIYHTERIFDYLNKNKDKIKFRTHKINKEEHIFEQGQNINNIIFVLNGTISLHRSSPQGRRYQVGTFNHTGFIGLMEVFSDKTCFYSVIAESDCEVLIIGAKSFVNLVCQTPDLAAITFKHLTTKWYLSTERMTRNILHSLSYCVIDDLLQFAQNNPGKAFIVNKSLECERLGTSLRVYNRILKQLNDIEAIAISREGIQILNVNLLINELNKEAK